MGETSKAGGRIKGFYKELETILYVITPIKTVALWLSSLDLAKTGCPSSSVTNIVSKFW
ncbi:MAG: hypothetical protein FWG14_10560 [Peptococcaceae bacterium]|nr:hypothetical protein [Peptococcaceae bacterium]